MHVLEDAAPEIPEQWAARRPELLHQFRVFNSDSKGYKGHVPRPANGMYEMLPPGSGREYESRTRAMWGSLSNKQRFREQCPVILMEGLVQGLQRRLLELSIPGLLSVLHMHGPEYAVASSSTNANRKLVLIPVSGYPLYKVYEDYSVSSGDVQWYGIRPKGPRELACNGKIAVSALRALPFASSFHTLSFQDCALMSVEEQRDAILAMVEVCRWNIYLTSLQFPPLCISLTKGGTRYVELWAQVGEAIWSNPRPLFTSLDFSGCGLGDFAMSQLLPALTRLFSSQQHGLAPVALLFSDCALSENGVASILHMMSGQDAPTGNTISLRSLQRLSFGGNPWNGAADVALQGLLNVLRQASGLRYLDLESSVIIVPVMDLSRVLVESSCPLRVLKLAGSAVPSREVQRAQSAIAVATT